MREVVMEGAISCKAVLECRKRPVREIWIEQKKRSHDIAYIENLAQKRGVRVIRQPRAFIDAKATGHSHGGVICFTSERPYDSIKDALPDDHPPFLIYAEGVEDPFNFGYMIRTIYAAGCDGLIVPARDWKDSEGIIEKSSAGAYERIPVIAYQDELLPLLIQKGVSIMAVGRKDAVNMYDVQYDGGIMLAFGGPLRGLARPILDVSAKTVCIPYERQFHNALNLTSAVCVLSYEVYRQRHVSNVQKGIL